MKTIVVYKSKYGSTKTYAEWIAKELGCEAKDAKKVKAEDLTQYDTVIYGGGLYAEVIAGVSLITKHFEALKEKKLIVFSTGLTPLDCTDYYGKMVVEKNFTPDMMERIKLYHYLGKMVVSELSLPHKAAIKGLKKLMSSKENPTEMEKLLISLCDADGDFTDKDAIGELVAYAKPDVV